MAPNRITRKNGNDGRNKRMKTALKILFFPMTISKVLIRILGRVIVGAMGFLLMAAGLFLIEPIQIPIVGIPLLLFGLILTIKAVF